MARPEKCPHYDSDKIMKNLLDAVSESYEETGELKQRAFEKVVELQGETVPRPKALGDIRGMTYIYPMLYRFGVIEVPEEDAWKMEVKRPLRKNH